MREKIEGLPPEDLDAVQCAAGGGDPRKNKDVKAIAKRLKLTVGTLVAGVIELDL